MFYCLIPHIFNVVINYIAQRNVFLVTSVKSAKIEITWFERINFDERKLKKESKIYYSTTNEDFSSNINLTQNLQAAKEIQRLNSTIIQNIYSISFSTDIIISLLFPTTTSIFNEVLFYIMLILITYKLQKRF
jgi:hypothetical protein